MSNAAMAQSIDRLSRATDPKTAIIKEIGQDVIDSYRLLEDDVLIGTYIRPERTKGGIILTDRSKEEDRFQGKVGLLLKMGPTAFRYDRSGLYNAYDKSKPNWEGCEAPQVGDWVVYRMSDAWEVSLRGVSCRIIRASLLRGAISDPMIIW